MLLNGGGFSQARHVSQRGAMGMWYPIPTPRSCSLTCDREDHNASTRLLCLTECEIACHAHQQIRRRAGHSARACHAGPHIEIYLKKGARKHVVHLAKQKAQSYWLEEIRHNRSVRRCDLPLICKEPEIFPNLLAYILNATS